MKTEKNLLNELEAGGFFSFLGFDQSKRLDEYMTKGKLLKTGSTYVLSQFREFEPRVSYGSLNNERQDNFTAEDRQRMDRQILNSSPYWKWSFFEENDTQYFVLNQIKQYFKGPKIGQTIGIFVDANEKRFKLSIDLDQVIDFHEVKDYIQIYAFIDYDKKTYHPIEFQKNKYVILTPEENKQLSNLYFKKENLSWGISKS